MGDLRQAGAVDVDDVDLAVGVEVEAAGERDLRPVRRPGGLQAPSGSGSAFGPPQPELGGTVSGRSPEPSLCMTQSELCTSGVTCRENAISFPWGDQLNEQQLADTVGGRIRLRPVPFTFTTNTPS